MATIVFVSPKGGVGKTTSAVLLACAIAQSGASTTLIDADPNRPVAGWASAGNVPPNLTIRSDVDEDNVLDAIAEAQRTSAFVLVDLEGSASKIVLMAATRADLVIIPTQGSQLDAEQAGRAIRVVRQTEQMSNRPLPYFVLFTRTNPVIRTRTTNHVGQFFVSNAIPVLETELNEREAFRAVFSFRRPLTTLDPKDVSNLDKAIENVNALTAELVGKLREARQARVAA